MTSPISVTPTYSGGVLIGYDYGYDSDSLPVDNVSLTVGHETLRRSVATNFTAGLSGGSIRLGYFVAARTETVTQLLALSGSVAAGATPTLVKFGLYSVDATTGDLTRQGVTANDTTIFAATSSEYVRTITPSVSVTRGSMYAIAVLVVSGFTIPTLAGTVAVNSTTMARAPRMGGVITGQTDLQASYAVGSITNSTYAPYFVALP